MTDIPALAAIRLGLLAPMTGIVALYGREIADAARIACDEINAKGGLLGRRLELCIEDDGSLPDTAVPAARRLLEHGCVALIGTLLSNSRIAVAEVVEQARVPMLNYSFNEGSVQRRHVFHFAALPNQQIERMIPFMVAEAGPKLFFAGNNYEWPRGSIDAAKRVLESIGGEVVGEEYLTIGADRASIDRLMNAVAHAGADVFVPFFAGDDQIAVLESFHAHGLKRRMAVVTGHFDEVMAARLSPEVREGIFSSNTYFMTVQTPEARRLLMALAEHAGTEGVWPRGRATVTNFAEGAYTCVQAFAHAVREAGTLDSEPLLHALEGVSFMAPQGQVSMDARTHHAWVNSVLARCQRDGQFEIVQAFGQIAPEIPARYAHLPLAAEALQPMRREPIVDVEFEGAWNGMADRILDIADAAVVAADEQGRIFGGNRGLCDLFGYRLDELLGMTVHDLLPPHLRAQHRLQVERFIASGSDGRRMAAYRASEVTGYRKDGSYVPIEAAIAKLRDGDRWWLVATLRDVSNARRIREELVRQATHDALTGLPNRAMIRDRIVATLRRARRAGHHCTLLFIDLDDFKTVNDTHGHEVGDALLRHVGDTLSRNIRPGDTLARLSGDEFVVLCEHTEHPGDASALAERLLDALREPAQVGSVRLGISASIGIAFDDGHLHSADELLRAADAAMYAVKETGRGRWRFFNAALHEEIQQRMAVTRGLRDALAKNQFQLHFQPIVEVASGRIVGAEALLRWASDDGMVPPSTFIPIAESIGLMGPLGRWVFEQGCRAEVAWRRAWGAEAPYVSINVSARQFDDRNLVAEFAGLLATTGADASRVVVEITETSLMADVESSQETLRGLTALGLRIAVDDFGTGYSSLAYLARLPVNVLKIDRTFVDGLEGSAEKRSIVRIVVALARSLGLSLVAEGVESAAQLAELRENGCDAVQGFLFHRPQSAAAFADTLRQRLSG